MKRERMQYTGHFDEVMATMTSRGLLLGSYDSQKNANLMTIGWGTLGSVWGVPAWMVFVRPSRYTFNGIEHSGCFTINVPTEEWSLACAVCGSQSGRDVDKFEETGFTPGRASSVLAPVAEECPIIYECRVIHASDVLPNKLSDEILSGSYRDGDFHRAYVGKILRAEAAPNASELLGA
jgi:flavin reductase (DIM6/NTAB) family NADH-FMN oxidoreductase RutF